MKHRMLRPAGPSRTSSSFQQSPALPWWHRLLFPSSVTPPPIFKHTQYSRSCDSEVYALLALISVRFSQLSYGAWNAELPVSTERACFALV